MRPEKLARIALACACVVALGACASRVTVFNGDGGSPADAPATDAARADAPAADAPPTDAPPPECARGQWCWEHPTPAGRPSLTLLTLSPDGSVGWALGRNGSAYRINERSITEANAPTMQSFDDAWTDSANVTWATAWRVEGFNRVSSLWRWDGSSWALAGPEGRNAYSVHGSAPNDVWTIAYRTDGEQAPWHWDGANWERRVLPVEGMPLSVCAHGPTEAWALTTTTGGLSGYMLVYWDGTRWIEDLRSGEDEEFSPDIVCPAAGEVWVRTRGRTSGSYGLFRWDGTRRTPVAPPAGALAVTSLRETGGRRVLAGYDGTVWRWTGSAWEGVLSRSAFSPNYPQVDVDLSRNNAIGLVLTDRGTLVRLAGDAAELLTGFVYPVAHLRAIAGFGEAPSIVVGEQLVGRRGPSSTWGFSALTPASNEHDLRAVAAIDGQTMWALGARGLAVRVRTSDSTLAVESVGTADLNAAWVHTASDVWAVGEGGAVVRFDGTRWSPFSPALPELVGSDPRAIFPATGVSGTSESDVWVVGNKPMGGEVPQTLALHWDGARWTEELVDQGSGGTVSVWAASAAEVWVAGPTVQRRGADGVWTSPFADVRSVRAMTASPDGALHFVLAEGTRSTSADRTSLGALVPFPRGVEGPNALWIGSTGERWVAARNGALLRYRPAP